MTLYIAPTAAGLPRTPYLTVAEYKADPDAVDYSSLVPGGSPQQQDDALAQRIWMASGRMDRFVHYVLGATQDTEMTRARVRRDGTVLVPTRGMPILEIDSFLVGGVPSALAAVTTAAAADAWVSRCTIRMPVIVANYVAAFGVGDRVYCQWTYVNGYPNTLLAVDAAAGATSIIVQSSLGIYPGKQLTIYDLGITESITVASSYVGGFGSSTTIPLVSGLVTGHSAGVAVSALPSDVKKAAVLMTTAMIKTRGSGAMVMESLDDERPGRSETGSALEEIALAESMLVSFVNPYFAHAA
jgi:hypothetical protein